MRASTCEISLKVSKINSGTETQYAEEMLDVLYPYATQYMVLWKKSVVIQTGLIEKSNVSLCVLEEVKGCLKEIENLPFTTWLRKQPNFREVRSRLITNTMIDCNIETTLANLVEFLAPNAKTLSNTVFIPAEWKRLVDKKMKELILMSRNFELAAEEHLFLSLVEKLKNSNGNVLNSGKPHKWQLREVMTKRIIQGLYNKPELLNETKTFIADIALELVGMFFSSVNKRDEAIKMAEKISKNLHDEKKFIQKQVIELLREYSSSQN